MKHLILFSILFAAVSNVFAASVSPPPIDEEIAVPATTEKDHVKMVSLGGKVFEFEKTTLREIQKVAGAGEIDHSGDAGESQYWLCYSFKNQTVWFISHGEMGGNEHELTQFQAVAKNLGCPSPKTKSQNIQTSFGWLGMSRQQLNGLLGSPGAPSKDSLKYFYLGKIPGPYNGKLVNWDVSVYIEATMENDKVSSIYASHVTSY